MSSPEPTEAASANAQEFRREAEASPVLEMIQVSVPGGSRGKPVLQEVDWRIEAGEFWFVGGLHRSGKTDLLMVATGLIEPLAGTCRLFGSERLPHPDAVRSRVGIVFDGGQLFHDLTVEENVALPIRYHGNVGREQAGTEIEPLLDHLQLTPMRNQQPSVLGRNWQQRVGLARALALKPQLLLLDGPLSGLDPYDVRWWTRMLGELAEGHELLEGRPLTLVVLGDDMQVWTKRASRFAVIKDRRLNILREPPGQARADDPLVAHLAPQDLGI